MNRPLIETLAATPPVATGGLILLGVSLANWVMVLTAIYTLFLIIDKLPTVMERIKQFYRWVKEYRL